MVRRWDYSSAEALLLPELVIMTGGAFFYVGGPRFDSSVLCLISTINCCWERQVVGVGSVLINMLKIVFILSRSQSGHKVLHPSSSEKLGD